MIKDRNGRIIPENSGQGKVLRVLYGTIFGRLLLKVLTLPLISELAGKFMDSTLSIPLIKPFIRRNRIDMRQYREQNYRSFNEFFTRKIKPSARPIPSGANELISPCDSKLTVYPVSEKSLFEIKGSLYSIADLLNDHNLARHYSGGLCMIFRLCVDDYHRYCFIDGGVKSESVFIKGELHTVNPIALGRYNIYKRNSREYTVLHTENFGDVVHVEVGAMLVGKICNRKLRRFRKGDEKGMFRYGGSTVVLLFEKDRVTVDNDILENSRNGIETTVKYGEKIGNAK
ncbi:MAG: phosphatidylserine decarboxylase [Ruminococcus sp.]|nr:phosphatidylserine decarboxylase [Ruminococcus sp.]